MHLLADRPRFGIASDSGSLWGGRHRPSQAAHFQAYLAIFAFCALLWGCGACYPHLQEEVPLSDIEPSTCQCQGHCPQVTGPAFKASVQLLGSAGCMVIP